MENKNGIYKKLLEFQKLEIEVERDASNPYFKSNYTTLNEVLEKVRKPLNDVGIVIIQCPDKDGLRTQLYDTTDDSSVECFMPYVEVTTAQKLGSSNTYNRRYSLITLLGLRDEDDDGNVASAQPKKKVEIVGDAARLANNEIIDADLGF